MNSNYLLFRALLLKIRVITSNKVIIRITLKKFENFFNKSRNRVIKKSDNFYKRTLTNEELICLRQKKQISDVVFKFYNNDSDTLSNPSLVFPIKRITNKSKVPAFKILGVYLDENLTFDFHFQSITSKVSIKSLFSLKKAKHILTSSALKYLYYALIHPHFLYCLPTISFTSQKNVNLLFKKQKLAVRLITKSKYIMSIHSLYFIAQVFYLYLS